MLQTFDSSVPLSTQRYLVAIKKSCRNKPKNHATSDHRVARAKQQRGARQFAKIQQARQRKKLVAGRRFWAGDWLK